MLVALSDKDILQKLIHFCYREIRPRVPDTGIMQTTEPEQARPRPQLVHKGPVCACFLGLLFLVTTITFPSSSPADGAVLPRSSSSSGTPVRNYRSR